MKKICLYRCTYRAVVLVVYALFATKAVAQSDPVVMASTTSTEQSGLFSVLLPAFKKATGVDIKVVAVGTGQAIDMARRGDADVLFVHDPAAEEKLVADGFAIKRHPVMYNDFVLVGPTNDPVLLAGEDITAAFKKLIAANTSFVKAGFISRGDNSGTHSAELRYWGLAGFDMSLGKPPLAQYKACGCGMGPALNMAASSGAYLLADRGTWLAFKNRANLALLVQGDARLFNQYGVMAVNPDKHPKANLQGARQFVEWVTSPAGQTVIASYKIGGMQVFFPNAPR